MLNYKNGVGVIPQPYKINTSNNKNNIGGVL